MRVDDIELRTALEAVLGRQIHSLSRRAWPYQSSAPIEELSLENFGSLLFKDVSSPTRPSRPSFMIDPLREIEAYDIVRDLGVPQLFGAVVGERRAWLFLERVDGIPLWQAEGTEVWSAAAHWLATLHTASVPSDAEHLLNYDTQYLMGWVERALEISGSKFPADLWQTAERAAELLADSPRVLVHGEFYPSNILVEAFDGKSRIRPVDWETAGIGPGVLDIAALTAGGWDLRERQAIVDAYCVGIGISATEIEKSLDAARLFIALQWLGWCENWSPPPEHEYDWERDVEMLAMRIAQ